MRNHLLNFAKKTMDKYPHLKQEINELLQLCDDSIADGESQENEVDLCLNSIQQLIDEEESK